MSGRIELSDVDTSGPRWVLYCDAGECNRSERETSDIPVATVPVASYATHMTCRYCGRVYGIPDQIEVFETHAAGDTAKKVRQSA